VGWDGAVMPMLDPETGSNLVTITKSDGAQRHLKKCSPSDWMKLANTFRHTRKVWKMISMTGQPPAAIQAALDELDKQRIFYDDVTKFLETWEGQYEAILLSLAKDHPFGTQRVILERDFDSLELEPGEWLKPAAALFNVKLVPLETTKKNDEEGKKGSTSGETTNPTTEEPPISSGTPSTLGTPTP
jgi:hypothetical protein